MKDRKARHCRTSGTAVVWPSGVEQRYGISGPTRWRWERAGKLPPRDVYIGGVAVGWRPATLDRFESGGDIPSPAAARPEAQTAPRPDQRGAGDTGASSATPPCQREVS